MDTDLDRLDRAVELAREALELSGGLKPEAVASQIGLDAEPDPATLVASQRLGTALDDWAEFSGQQLDSLCANTLPDTVTEVRAWASELRGELVPLATQLRSLQEMTGQKLTLGDLMTLTESRECFETRLGSLMERHDVDQALLGPDYCVLDTDFSDLDEHLRWSMGLRELNQQPMHVQTAEALVAGPVSSEGLREARVGYEAATALMLDLFDNPWRHRLSEDLSVSFDDGRMLLEGLEETIGDIDEWSRFNLARNELADAGLLESLEFLVEERTPLEQVPGSIERATLEAWINSVNQVDPRLENLSADDRDDLRQRFLKLDRALVRNASANVINTCTERRPDTSLGAVGIIRREAQKRSRHKPIRQLLDETWDVAVALKPCFMMSPLSVSQFLPSNIQFDVVIFDEASQVTPADAISSVYRGKQIIIAGDQLQLPPTNFFDAQVGGDPVGDDDEEALDDFESVLDSFKGTSMPELPLKWHYRSQHESLITYSNYRFYEGRLQTFPGAAEHRPDLGVELIHVNGIYRRGASRDNPIEATAVVDRVLHHRRLHPDLTIGVVAFSSAQQQAILTEIERRTASDPELQSLNFDDRLNGFFVKNLENVQGDDRDIIVFSIGYGRDENGAFSENLGPLSRQGGQRRLNVAITRARRRVDVVSSVRASDFPGTSQMPGVRHLQRYLDFAERGINALALDLTESLGDAESPFEEAVISAINELGFHPVPQVGVAGYRIDIGVRHPERPGEFVLGIECDGAQYHSSQVARDRDRLRQAVLEGLGWRIHRIWGPSWYRDRSAQIEALRGAIESALNSKPTRKPRDATSRPPVVEIDIADLDARPQWVIDYRKSNWNPGYANPEETPVEALAEGVLRIVTDEGPIHRDLVLHRIKEAFGRKRLTKQLRDLLDPALKHARRTGNVDVVDTKFLCLPGAPIMVRAPAEDDESPRGVLDIAPSERRLALKKLIEESLIVGQDEVVQAAARLFGWRRSSEEIAATLRKDLKRLARDGEIDI